MREPQVDKTSRTECAPCVAGSTKCPCATVEEPLEACDGTDLDGKTCETEGFYDDSPRLAYCSVDFEGRVVFGGGTTEAYDYRFGNKTTYEAARHDRGERALVASLHRYLPELADVPIRHRWSGPLDLTLARHCAIGVMGSHRNVYYGVGYSGHGITLANLAGSVIADLYAGNHDPWRECSFYMKRPTGIPPEPFRWVGYQLITRLTGKSPWKRPD